MAKIVKPPQPVSWDHERSVFLAGTIDNGTGVNWQSQVEQSLSDLDVMILNPRRDEWDASWQQSIDNPMFRQQVEWELSGLENASHILMYFVAHSQSPITLLEFGLHARSGKLIIVCEPQFWRRGNIEVVAHRYEIPLYEDLETGLKQLRSSLMA